MAIISRAHETTLNALNQLARCVREAWKQELQSKDVQQSHLRLPQPPSNKALDHLSRIEELEKFFGGDLKSWLQESISQLSNEFGALSDWVKEDITSATPLDWYALADSVYDAIDQARRCVKNNRIDSGAIWDISSRAIISLSFAIRAVNELHIGIEKGALPEGACIAKRPGIATPLPSIQVLDADGSKIGVSESLEDAIREAVIWGISDKETYELTPDEFVSTTTVIHVIPSEKAGFMDPASPEDLTLLRSFLRKARIRSTQGQEGNDCIAITRWVEASLKSIMSDPFDGAMNVLRLKGAGHLILCNSVEGQVEERHLRDIHSAYIKLALCEGYTVPAHVLDAVGIASPRSIPVLRSRQSA